MRFCCQINLSSLPILILQFASAALLIGAYFLY